jgi:hypothetical protein
MSVPNRRRRAHCRQLCPGLPCVSVQRLFPNRFDDHTCSQFGWYFFQAGDLAYRNSLCERITHTVTNVALSTNQLLVSFDDKSVFEVSLSEEGRAGNEALVFQFPEEGQKQMLVLHII